MPIKIEWRREPDLQHTGSVELNGVQGKPFIYVHVQDQAQQPRRSPAVEWQYNNRDMANNNIVAHRLFLNLQGGVSFDSYLLHRRHFQAMAAADRFEGWAGQDGTAEVFNASLATGLQPSGFGTYTAYISQAPHRDTNTTVTLTADLRTLSVFIKPFRARIGMARSVSAEAYAFNHVGEQAQCRSRSRLSRFRPLQIRRRRQSATFPVLIPAGGEVKIGKIQCGLGYEQRSSRSRFYCSSVIDFQVA